MRQVYSDCFIDALENYKNQAKRHGYCPGMFAAWRHSKKSYGHIDGLQKQLLNLSDDVAAKEVLKNYFNSPATKFNNHSFALYFLDQLMAKDAEGNWDRFYPKQKQVKFYNGIVYRGTLQKPEDALKNGICALSRSPRVDDYACHTSMSIGVSTSKDKEVAKAYQTSVFPTGMSCYFEVGYLYEINYRGVGGIDIVETLKARGNLITSDGTQEVNIMGRISPNDIVGYWNKNGEFIENPNYDHKKGVSLVSAPLVERMKALGMN